MESRQSNELSLDDLKLFISKLSSQIQTDNNEINQRRLKTLLTNLSAYLKLLQNNSDVRSQSRSVANLIDSLIKEQVLTEDSKMFAKDINNNGNAIRRALNSDSSQTQYFFLFLQDQLDSIFPKTATSPSRTFPSINRNDIEAGITLMIVLLQRELAKVSLEDTERLLFKTKDTMNPDTKTLLLSQAVDKYKEALGAFDSIPIKYRTAMDDIERFNVLISLNNLLISLRRNEEAFQYAEQILKMRDDLPSEIQALIPARDLDTSELIRSMSRMKYQSFIKTREVSDLEIAVSLLKKIPDKTLNDYLMIVDRLDWASNMTKDPKEKGNYSNSILTIIDEAINKFPEQREDLTSKRNEYMLAHQLDMVLAEASHLHQEVLQDAEQQSEVNIQKLMHAYHILKRFEHEVGPRADVLSLLKHPKETIIKAFFETFSTTYDKFIENDPDKVISLIEEIQKIKKDNPDIDVALPAALNFTKATAYVQKANLIKDNDVNGALECLQKAEQIAGRVETPSIKLMLKSIINQARAGLPQKVEEKGPTFNSQEAKSSKQEETVNTNLTKEDNVLGQKIDHELKQISQKSDKADMSLETLLKQYEIVKRFEREFAQSNDELSVIRIRKETIITELYKAYLKAINELSDTQTDPDQGIKIIEEVNKIKNDNPDVQANYPPALKYNSALAYLNKSISIQEKDPKAAMEFLRLAERYVNMMTGGSPAKVILSAEIESQRKILDEQLEKLKTASSTSLADSLTMFRRAEHSDGNEEFPEPKSPKKSK